MLKKVFIHSLNTVEEALMYLRNIDSFNRHQPVYKECAICGFYSYLSLSFFHQLNPVKFVCLFTDLEKRVFIWQKNSLVEFNRRIFTEKEKFSTVGVNNLLEISVTYSISKTPGILVT